MKRNATLVRPSGTDRFGDAIEDATEIEESATWVISLANASDSSDGQRNSESTFVTAYVLGTTQALASDLVRIDGFLWQVDGHPVRAESPFTGRLAGYTVRLKQYLG